MDYSDLSAEELVKACAEQENAEAREEFARRYRSLIGFVVQRIARRRRDYASSVVNDLIQETFLKILTNNYRLLRDFRPQHPDAFEAMLAAMLRVTAANAARDYFRALDADKRGSGTVAIEISEIEAFVPDSRFSRAAQIEQQVLFGQIDLFLAGLPSPFAARDRDIFWLHYRQGFTAIEIAKIATYQLSVKGVESILHRLRNLVRQFLAEQDAEEDNAQSASKGIARGNPLKEEEGQP